MPDLTYDSSASVRWKTEQARQFPVSSYRPRLRVHWCRELDLPEHLHMFHFARVGDINQDGDAEIIYAKGCAEQVVYTLKGDQIWRYEDRYPDVGYPVRPDTSVPIFDFDGDGRTELACFRRISGVPHLCLVDAATGILIRSTPIEVNPKDPHGSLIPCNVDGPLAPSGLLFHRDYWRIELYGFDLKLRWTVEIPELGHTTNAADINGDGTDEFFTGTRLYDAVGRCIWSRAEILDGTGESHPDSNRIRDLDCDGTPELIVATGAQVLNPDGSVRWKRNDLLHHAQSVRVLRQKSGESRLCFTDLPRYETPSRLEWRNRLVPDVTCQCVILDADGAEVSRFPGVHTPQVGDWDGDGDDEIFVLAPDRVHVDVRNQDGTLADRIPVQFKAYISDMVAAPVFAGANGCQLITHSWSEDEQETHCHIHHNPAAVAPARMSDPTELASYTCY